MARPGNGSYVLRMPPIPFGVNVVVTDAGMRIPALGSTAYPWSEAAEAFSLALDIIVTCDSVGHWTVIKGEDAISGTCTGPS